MIKKLFLLLLTVSGICSYAQEFNPVPRAWKWIGNSEAIFSYDGTFGDSMAFYVNAKTGKKRT